MPPYEPGQISCQLCLEEKIQVVIPQVSVTTQLYNQKYTYLFKKKLELLENDVHDNSRSSRLLVGSRGAHLFPVVQYNSHAARRESLCGDVQSAGTGGLLSG